MTHVHDASIRVGMVMRDAARAAQRTRLRVVAACGVGLNRTVTVLAGS